MNLEDIAVIILAAGKGNRMKSVLPKPLHLICDKPMIFYALDTLAQIGFSKVVVVVSKSDSRVKDSISEKYPAIDFAFQAKPLGTAHGVRSALSVIPDKIKYLFYINADDSAFYTKKTLQNFLQSHIKSQAKISMLTLKTKNELELGRIIKDHAGNFKQILESSEYFASGLKSDEINCGAYVFDQSWFKQNVSKVTKSKSGEYYVTELLNIAKSQNQKINLYNLEDENEWVGINTQDDLNYANKLMAERIKDD